MSIVYSSLFIQLSLNILIIVVIAYTVIAEHAALKSNISTSIFNVVLLQDNMGLLCGWSGSLIKYYIETVTEDGDVDRSF